MTDAVPVPPAQPPGPAPRKPRKIFLLVGVVLAVALGVGLFTSVGTSQSPSSSGGGVPQAGDPVPAFTATNIGRGGPGQVAVPGDGGGHGTAAVLLFFGAWCPSCHQELPPLAAAARAQAATGGPLSKIRVIGVDSEDTPGSARSFIASSGVTFPVAYDPNLDITSGLFSFTGDPYAVFVKGDGTIAKVVAGDGLTPASFTADERALIPSGT
jgi:peroxiredoxin